MAALRTSGLESVRCSIRAGMVIGMSSRNSATNTLEHTNWKATLTHTLRFQPGKELDDCLANIRLRILQIFRNDRNDDPNVLLKFSYKRV